VGQRQGALAAFASGRGGDLRGADLHELLSEVLALPPLSKIRSLVVWSSLVLTCCPW
jgi:hypothetical protein